MADIEPERSRHDRRSALAIGAATLLASGVFRQLLGLFTLAITARLLTPEDFGAVAYFLLAVTFLEMMQRQIAQVLIRYDAVTPAHVDTVFTLQIMLGLCGALLFFALRPVMGLVGLPSLVVLLPYLSVMSLIIAARSSRFLLYERGLRFGYAAGEETLSRVLYSITAIFFAWLWRDYWCIVVASFVGQTARSIWTFSMAPMRPRLRLTRWRDSFSFSSWAIGAQISQFFYKNVPLMVIGSALGLAEAGLFRLGNRLTTMVTTQLTGPMLRVLYPGLAEVARDTDRKHEVFLKMNALVLGLVLPVGIGIALVSRQLIWIGFGEQWIPAGVVIWILAPLRAVESIQANVRAAAYVQGTTRYLFFRNTLLLILVSFVMWFGTRYGFEGALVAAGLSSVAGTILSLVMARQFGSNSFFEPLIVAWRSFAACLVMVVVIALFGWWTEIVDLPVRPWEYMMMKVAIGAATYTTVSILLWIWSGRPDGFESTVLSLFDKFWKFISVRAFRRTPRT